LPLGRYDIKREILLIVPLIATTTYVRTFMHPCLLSCQLDTLCAMRHIKATCTSIWKWFHLEIPLNKILSRLFDFPRFLCGRFFSLFVVSHPDRLAQLESVKWYRYSMHYCFYIFLCWGLEVYTSTLSTMDINPFFLFWPTHTAVLPFFPSFFLTLMKFNQATKIRYRIWETDIYIYIQSISSKRMFFSPFWAAAPPQSTPLVILFHVERCSRLMYTQELLYTINLSDEWR
jgi:hypothetical protein